MLSQRVDVVNASETLDPTTLRPVQGNTVRHAAVPAVIIKRGDLSIVYDDDGTIVTDYDAILTAEPQPGDEIVVTTGTPSGTYLVTGVPRPGVRRPTGETVTYRAPCRRIQT